MRRVPPDSTRGAPGAAWIPTAGEAVDAPTQSDTRSNDTADRAEPRTGPAAAPPWAEVDGCEVDGYYVERLLRRTPATDVYLARDRAAGSWREVVVVRHLPGVDPTVLRRAVDLEVYAAGALMPPGAAPVVDVGRTRDGRLYVATARPLGRSLREVLADDGAMPAQRALDLGLTITRMVAAAHDAGLVHGWLTPDSVVVVPQQGAHPERVVVLGFGTTAAQDGRPVPAPFPAQLFPYASPERAAGRPASARGDVFSLASVMLSMLSGGPPPPVRTGRSTAVGLDAPELQPLGQVLARARASNPRERYASATELGAALETALADAVGAVGRATAQHPSVAQALATHQPAADAGEQAAPSPAPLELPVPGSSEGGEVLPGDGRRSRRGVLVAAGVAGVVVLAAALTWRSRAEPDAPPPLADAAQTSTPALTSPPPSTRGPAPVQAPAATAGPDSALGQGIPPADSAPTVPRAVAQNVPLPSSEGAAVRTVPLTIPAARQTVVGRAAVPVRNAAAVRRRGPAVAGPAPLLASAQGTGRTLDGRTAPLAAPTGSAAGEVVTAGAPAGAPAGARTAGDAPASEADAGIESVTTAAGVRAAVAEYATAIQARDVAGLRRVYPGMTEQQRSAWVAFFGSVANLRTRLAVWEIMPMGDAVRVRVRGTYEYQNLHPRRAERLPVSFTATLARGGSGWRVRTVE